MTEPLPQRIVPFYGDELIAAQQTDSTIYVLFTRLCENLGLARWSQVRRVQSHEILNEGFELLTIHTEGGTQAVQCLRLDLLPLWMSGLHARRVKPEIQPKLVVNLRNRKERRNAPTPGPPIMQPPTPVGD